MNERDDEAPFPREPWKRLLEDSSGGPPETTDARIRAAARRNLAPRGQRWWLPASLAASLLLAVVLVRSELGSQGGVTDRSEKQEARAPAAESDVYDSADSAAARAEAGAEPRVGGPERELKSASETPGENAPLESSTARPDLARAAQPAPAQAPPAAAQSAAVPAAKEARRLDEITATKPTPDAWYAAIEKLRAEGHTEEADRETEKLEAAYPGWLEQHLEAQKKR